MLLKWLNKYSHQSYSIVRVDGIIRNLSATLMLRFLDQPSIIKGKQQASLSSHDQGAVETSDDFTNTSM